MVLQVNCRSIYNKALDIWNLVDTYNPDAVIDTEPWLQEDIGNAEVFRADFTTFRKDRSVCYGESSSALEVPLPIQNCGQMKTTKYSRSMSRDWIPNIHGKS
jgi:hypothetical protein